MNMYMYNVYVYIIYINIYILMYIHNVGDRKSPCRGAGVLGRILGKKL